MSNPLLLGIQGLRLTKETREELEEMKPRGIIFFARNFSNKEQFKELVIEIKLLEFDLQSALSDVQ